MSIGENIQELNSQKIERLAKELDEIENELSLLEIESTKFNKDPSNQFAKS